MCSLQSVADGNNGLDVGRWQPPQSWERHSFSLGELEGYWKARTSRLWALHNSAATNTSHPEMHWEWHLHHFLGFLLLVPIMLLLDFSLFLWLMLTTVFLCLHMCCQHSWMYNLPCVSRALPFIDVTLPKPLNTPSVADRASFNIKLQDTGSWHRGPQGAGCVTRTWNKAISLKLRTLPTNNPGRLLQMCELTCTYTHMCSKRATIDSESLQGRAHALSIPHHRQSTWQLKYHKWQWSWIDLDFWSRFPWRTREHKD
jgi:hypothetical protein